MIFQSSPWAFPVFWISSARMTPRMSRSSVYQEPLASIDFFMNGTISEQSSQDSTISQSKQI
jgi:hypothetical protein